MSRAQKLAWLNIFAQVIALIIGSYLGHFGLVSIGASLGAIIYMYKDVV